MNREQRITQRLHEARKRQRTMTFLIPNSSFLIALLIALCSLLFANCVSQYKVVVNFSPALRDHFTQFPTIEVDIAALTDGEANELKQAGVEKYFAPDSGFRERFQSQTAFYYREEQHTYVLPSRAPVWQAWKLKDAANVLVIASLPPEASISPGADPRYLVVKMAKSFVLARTLNVMVEPRRVVQLSSSAAKALGNEASAPVTVEQWMEKR